MYRECRLFRSLNLIVNSLRLRSHSAAHAMFALELVAKPIPSHLKISTRQRAASSYFFPYTQARREVSNNPFEPQDIESEFERLEILSPKSLILRAVGTPIWLLTIVVSLGTYRYPGGFYYYAIYYAAFVLGIGGLIRVWFPVGYKLALRHRESLREISRQN